MPPRPAWIFPWRDFSWRVVLILATCIGTGLPPSVNAKMVADQRSWTKMVSTRVAVEDDMT